MNDLLLRTLSLQTVERPPIWMMRQAGRHLPSYQKLRDTHSLRQLFFEPELAAQVTLLPIQEYGLDAAILFSDILVIAKAFGLSLDYVDKIGPIVSPQVRSFEDVEKLQAFDVEDSLQFVAETIRILRKELNVPLIGFCGGPITSASYFIETGRSHLFPFTKKWIYRDPAGLHTLLKKITDVNIAYLQMQEKAGAQVVQIFESWAHVLSEELFCEFSLPYLRKMVQGVSVPVILFVKGGGAWVEHLVSTKPQALGFDWQRSLKAIRKEVPEKIIIQGNFDPDFLYAPDWMMHKVISEKAQEMQGRRGWIVNLGHGIKPDISVDSVKQFIAMIQEATCSMSPL